MQRATSCVVAAECGDPDGLEACRPAMHGAPRIDRRFPGWVLASILSFSACQPAAGPDEVTDRAFLDEEMYVLALFTPWAVRVVGTAETAPGDRFLDVACGTGVVGREARRRLGRADQIVRLDISPGMLVVARRIASEITWQLGDAQALPFADAGATGVRITTDEEPASRPPEHPVLVEFARGNPDLSRPFERESRLLAGR
jgi:SAM-dependent methyltransferase